MNLPHSVKTPGTLPVLPLRMGVVLPGRPATIPVGRDRSLELARALSSESLFVLAAQKDPRVEEPGFDELHSVGVMVRLLRRDDRGRGVLLRVDPIARVRLTSLEEHEPHLRGTVDHAEEKGEEEPEAELLAESLRGLMADLVDAKVGLDELLGNAGSNGRTADIIAAFVDASDEEKKEVLLELDVVARLRKVRDLVHAAKTLAELRNKVDTEVRQDLNEQQRRALLRKQIEVLQRELGDEPDADDRDAELKAKLDALDLTDEARKVVDREWRRLSSMPEQQAETHVIRNYLELIADLPWNERSEDATDVGAIADALEEDHYGLDEVKRRILEHMAVVERVGGEQRGTILCLAGPPGVGKTSLAQSIARATGRPFERVSLGGIRDEAEIRGHRRTYVGALPGRIINAMRKAGTKNPVIVLDEVDKLSRGISGDPEAALLEVLDPEQNHTFTDHYLELPFDLSEVLFIATANDLSTMSPPLRDRLEIIEVRGYTAEEKLEIAKRHLAPASLLRHGLAECAAGISDTVLEEVISAYTREAGVRQLRRRIDALARHLTLEAARSKSGKVPTIRVKDLRSILGKPVHRPEMAEAIRKPGVAAGLAWTPVGGDVLYVESVKMPGKGRVEITGQLGDVMKESVSAALSFIRSEAQHLGVDTAALEDHDVHVHVPAGAIPKDGPSAGVTMFTALSSLLSGRRVRTDTAMTGEATLRGRVLPVGGIKEKVLAAHRAGMRRVILPEHNGDDLDELPESVRGEMEFILASDMVEVLDAALESERGGKRGSEGRGKAHRKSRGKEPAVAA